MKAIGFDLGDTLIYYKNVPLNWEKLYSEALLKVVDCCNLVINEKMLFDAEHILAKYNTRLNPRIEEIDANKIFTEILLKWNFNVEKNLVLSQEVFFEFFQKKVSLYDDTIPILAYLKNRNLKIGILTDVPYGMNKQYVNRDIELISEYIELALTSVEVGRRKPCSKGYLELAKFLKVEPYEMIYVGNEEKDIIGANNAGIYSVLINRDDKAIFSGEKLRITSLLELKSLFD
jgi:putative hydrolase of the HAD superfamily